MLHEASSSLRDKNEMLTTKFVIHLILLPHLLQNLYTLRELTLRLRVKRKLLDFFIPKTNYCPSQLLGMSWERQLLSFLNMLSMQLCMLKSVLLQKGS